MNRRRSSASLLAIDLPQGIVIAVDRREMKHCVGYSDRNGRPSVAVSVDPRSGTLLTVEAEAQRGWTRFYRHPKLLQIAV